MNKKELKKLKFAIKELVYYQTESLIVTENLLNNLNEKGVIQNYTRHFNYLNEETKKYSSFIIDYLINLYF